MKSSKYINRELSWLQFNRRVLEEAQTESVPLLERLKFVAISASNLDEFFMVRVGGLRILKSQGIRTRDPAAFTPAEQLKQIHQQSHALLDDMHSLFAETLEPLLAGNNIHRLRPNALSEEQLQYLETFFEQELSAIVTPAAVSRASKFPLLRNLWLHMVVRLHPEPGKRAQRFAVFSIGPPLERFITVPADAGYRYILIEDVVKLFSERLFPGERVAEVAAFRITRNAEMSVGEDEAEDLLGEMEHVLESRKRSDCVRLEVEKGTTKTLAHFLARALHLENEEVYKLPAPLDLSRFMKFSAMEGFDNLRYEDWPPQASPLVDRRQTMFDTIKQRDLLLIHPYESFDPVVRFVQEAAQDPDVLAIKQILYRTSRNSPVVDALRDAAQNGKYVTVIVELKARFDEAQNISWARRLEQEGVQVIYGVKGLKTHAKICIVVRRETAGIVRYLHFGTGNYNEKTARLYSDISYFTCAEDYGTDASTFFNAVSGYSAPQRYLKLEMAPIGLRAAVLELIRGETERSRQGQAAHIMAKLNSLVDTEIIDALYEASQAGVRIDLNIRGICCLRPAVAHFSENIRVVSIVDRFLEHARILYFRHGGENRIFISSADWMPRNLDRRVELLVPVEDPSGHRRLMTALETYFQDNVKARELCEDGSYEAVVCSADETCVRSQKVLYQRAEEAINEAEQFRRSVFVPHRPPVAGD